MRTRVIPAQITTVEDKIVGNLNFMQAGLIMLPILYATVSYIFFPPVMSFGAYKFASTIIVTFVCIVMSLRIKGKIVANWLVVISRYRSRPRRYVYNKNDIFMRSIYMPSIQRKTNHKVKPVVEPLSKKDLKEVHFADMVTLDDVSIAYQVDKKGGLRVALQKD